MSCKAKPSFSKYWFYLHISVTDARDYSGDLNNAQEYLSTSSLILPYFRGNPIIFDNMILRHGQKKNKKGRSFNYISDREKENNEGVLIVHPIKFWCCAVYTPARNLLWNGPQVFKSKAGPIKCCKETKITALPNDCCNIPFCLVFRAPF